MKAQRKNLRIENAALRDQIRDLKENLRATNARAAYWASEVRRLRLEVDRHRRAGRLFLDEREAS